MHNYEVATPSAAEAYFNHSVFGQLYTLIAEGLRGEGGNRRQASKETVADRPPHWPEAVVPAIERSPKQHWLDRLDGWLWRIHQRDREAYLAGAQDVFELERRMRAYDRGPSARYY